MWVELGLIIYFARPLPSFKLQYFLDVVLKEKVRYIIDREKCKIFLSPNYLKCRDLNHLRTSVIYTLLLYQIEP